MYHQIEKTYNRNSESVIKVIEAKKDENHNGYIRRDKKALLLILQRKKIYRFNANNSCFFSISHSPLKSNSSSCFKDKICELHKYKKHFIGDIATKLEDNAL